MKELNARMRRTLEWLAEHSYLEVTLVSKKYDEYVDRYVAIKGRQPPQPTIAKSSTKKGGSQFRLVIPVANERYRRSLELDFNLAPLGKTSDGRGWRRGIGTRTGDLFWHLLVHGFDVPGAQRAQRRVVKARTRSALQEEKDIGRMFSEGQLKQVIRELQQRNASLIRLAKKIYPTKCCVCDFDFGVIYGQLGQGFVEAHHLTQLASSKRKQDKSVDKIRLVCSNCHRMLHRRKPMLSIEELRDIVDKQRAKRR